MSRPLLNSSPTVGLGINTGRELEANVIADPSANNALRIRPDGLYVKRGVRKNAWNLQRFITFTTAGVLANATQANQVLTWPLEQTDPDGLVDLIAQPTRVTAIESGYYWSRPYVFVGPVGGTTVSQSASTGGIVTLKNGTTWVAGQETYSYAPVGASVFFQVGSPAYVYLNAGDYLEVYWRWTLHELLTATSWSWQGQWAGGRIGE